MRLKADIPEVPLVVGASMSEVKAKDFPIDTSIFALFGIISQEMRKFEMDDRDRDILREIQRDASVSIEDLAARVHLSRNACWRRVKLLEEQGIIRSRVALLDPSKLNLDLTAFIAIRTSSHDQQWLDRFSAAVKDIPEIIGVYRTTGETDYMLQAVVPDIAGYDLLYKRLIAKVPLTDVSSFFVMEKVKETTELPLSYV
jgi:Lrp/AsnC family transcriptional regulator